MVDDFFCRNNYFKKEMKEFIMLLLLGNIYLEDESIDGILYQSVKSGWSSKCCFKKVS